MSSYIQRYEGGESLDIAQIPPRKGVCDVQTLRFPGHTQYVPGWNIYIIKHGRLMGKAHTTDPDELNLIRRAARERGELCVTQKIGLMEPADEALKNVTSTMQFYKMFSKSFY